MSIAAKAVFSTEGDSLRAGRDAANEILDSLGAAPAVALAYLTVNHDQDAFLRGFGQTLGSTTTVLGASAQGVMTRGDLREEGYAAGVMGLGGLGLRVSGGFVEDILVDTRAKGRELGRQLKQGLAGKPKVAVLHYDPLAGVDMHMFLEGMQAELGCPIIGGSSAHFYGPMHVTYQYFGDRVLSKGAVAFAIAGDCTTEMIISNGCSPIGVEMTVTRADGAKILELDGRRAVDVWQEITGTTPRHFDHTASVALGVPLPGSRDTGEYLVRAAFGVSEGGIVVQVAIPEGTRVMLHHRTIEDCLDGTRLMGDELKHRLSGKKLRAVLGFECGARTVPFLGKEAARDENIQLQQRVDPDAEWLGIVTWGEIYPVAGQAGFHNYTFPMLALAD